MLKSEYFADIRGFRCNKQQAGGLCVWAISDINVKKLSSLKRLVRTTVAMSHN